MEGYLEETVERGPSGIDCGNACRGDHDVLLLGVPADVAQECRLTRPRLSWQGKRPTGIVYDLERLLELLVLRIYDIFRIFQFLNLSVCG